MSGIKDFFHQLKTHSNPILAILVPITFVMAIIFIVLVIFLYSKKRALKAKLNKTPEGSPPSSDSEVFEKADIIPRPHSVV